MKIEKRPAVYFPSMTTEEVSRYAGVYAETKLEEELLARMNYTTDKLADVENTVDKLWEALDAGKKLEEAVRECDHIEERVLDALDEYRERVSKL